MTASTWRQVKDVYTAASALPVAEREGYLAGIERDNVRVATEARRLLRLDQGAEEQLASLKVPSGLLAAAAERRTFYEGERLAGRYQIRRFLASGGMGEVYEAEDFERGERIAIKSIRPELAKDTHLSWLRREIELASRIEHPNICRVYDVVEAEGRAFLTMELLEGETLAAHLRRHGTLSERQALPLIRQIIAGLHAAHSARVIHRDLKPSNIMIVPRPEGAPRVVLMDFGLARQSPADQATMHSQTWSIGIGTPAYMAPEQIEGRKSTVASDIYSLGVVLFEVLTGQLPFANDSPLSLAVRKTRQQSPSALVFSPNLRPAWARMLRRCLHSNPAQRFGAVTEILPALESRSRTQYLRRRARRWLQSSRNLILLLLLMGLGGAALWVIYPWPPSEAATLAWDRGIQALHAGSPSAAIGFFEQSLATGRAPARIHADLALAWHALEFPAQAEAALRRSPRWFHPDDEYLQAITHYIQNRHAEALGALRELPDNSTRMADLAMLGKGPLARWRRVAYLRPDYAPAHLHIADAAALEGRWREADSEFQAAQTYFDMYGNRGLSRLVAARRGVRRLASGDTQLALADLAAGSGSGAGSGAGLGSCEHSTVLVVGVPDNFGATPDPLPYASRNFINMFPRLFDSPRRGFDEVRDNQEFVFSIPLPPVRVCSAKVEFRIRRGPEVNGADNDLIQLGAAPFDATFNPPDNVMLWPDALERNDKVVVFDLKPQLFANIQRVYAGKDVASLDMIAGDDTIFDYFKLTLYY
jgi:tRNA A-37 threonylcarbamoyl transferase component Bud32/tetratricopeptide (TPR) repeat protein